MFADITDTALMVISANLFRATQGTGVWWRGEPAKYPTALTPSMLRVPRGKNEEPSILGHFRQRAHARASSLPQESDQSGWLFLMQHHGLPTRLLDWSQNALAALYFAASREPEKDGFVWGLNPTALNDAQVGKRNLLLPKHVEVSRILKLAFAAQGASDHILAVMPAEADLRMLLQLGRYTIHGDPGDLVAAAGVAPYLKRWRVPAPAKSKLLSQLQVFGVDRAQLFPDLASLAAEIDGMSLTGPAPATEPIDATESAPDPEALSTVAQEPYRGRVR